MMNVWLSLGALVLILLGSANAEDTSLTYQNSSLSIDQRVEDLLSRMTLEEKIAQMRIFHATKGIRLSKKNTLILSEDVQERLELGIAGIKNPGERIPPYQAALLNNLLQKYIIETNRLSIPALFITEAYNGVDAKGCTRFGRPINLAATWNVALAHKVWDVIGREARLRGMHMCHSPEADLVRDPRFGRMSEAFGEDTLLTTEMVVSAVRGVQGGYSGNGRINSHIGAVTKHFAGYGQVLGGRNFAAIEISPRVLRDEIFPPFYAAVKRGHSLGIMASHGDINGIASHANSWLLTDLLKNQWMFSGYVVSDSNDIARLHSFMKVAEDPEAAAKMALQAGIDIDLYSDTAYALLPEMVHKEACLKELIDHSVRRVLRTKFILGLFDNPYIDLDTVPKGVRSDQSLTLAKQMDEESIILLKNEDSLLPIDNSTPAKVALLGPLLDEETKKNFESIAGENISFISNQGFQLTNESKANPKLSTNNQKAIDDLVAMADDSDVVILFLGGDEFTAKEAYFNNTIGDRDVIEPVGDQDKLLQEIQATDKPIVVVLKHRRTLSINAATKYADAILDCWDLGEFGDSSLAKVIFGDVCPSGKLPVTVPRSIGQIPFHYSQKEINYKKDYLFIEPGPLYPFGHGLSYTTFQYSNLKLSSQSMIGQGEITVSIDITNRGDYAGKEVIQLYLKDVIGSITRPDKELKAFKKIKLLPGETRRVEFAITPDMLKFTGMDMKPLLESGEYKVMIGTSSSELQEASFYLQN